jgi:type I restriction enzyme, R subunit
VTPSGGAGPEQVAREAIDRLLKEAGWIVQSRDDINLSAGWGVAIREFKLTEGFGYADYLLFVDGEAVGVLEAKPQGHTLGGVEPQVQRYASGLPAGLEAPVLPLPFLYLSTGTDTRFVNLLDPDPRTRRLTQNRIHRPVTIAEWLSADPLPQRASRGVVEALPNEESYEAKPSSLRARLRALPPVHLPGLWRNKVEAITNLEKSLYNDRPRALIQMATGSGKTLLAITSIYRLIKDGGARRILFLVDRQNLGEQAEKEFQNYRTPDDNRKFAELYNVQRLTSNTIASSAKVVITTIQRLYSMLRGDPELDPSLEEGSQFDAGGGILAQTVPVNYNPAIPIEFFDFIWVDECHRSIYSLWRQVLEYFDAYLVGLTATPSKQTFGFFNQNLVMEYGHEQAVADGVNVEFEVYRIRTQITQQGSTIEAGPETVVGIRDRQTRSVRWERPDEDVAYDPDDLDRKVVARDQIRLLVRTFRDRLFTEIFPGRREVPKTLIFAKDDSHAEDILQVVREEFGRGNEFAQKITYKVTGRKAADLIQDFRNSFNPRIAVTVDMIATGTDIKPIEIVVFMRAVKSRVYFEQMKGRGVRIIDKDELQAVTPDALAKTHFVIVDCVGVCEKDLSDTQPLERKPSASFKSLLEHVALGGTDPDVLSSLVSRLARLDRQCGSKERDLIAQATGGASLEDISRAVVQALDPDRQVEEARTRFALREDQEPSQEQIKQVATGLGREAVKVLATNPQARMLLIEMKAKFEQIIDDTSLDVLDEAGFSEDARAKARGLVEDFEKFLVANRDEIDALQFFYSQPYQSRLHYQDIKALAAAIEAPPRQWTPERLWRAYETLDRSKVRGASAKKLLVDLVSLVRFALHQKSELVPYSETVHERFERWVAEQRTRGRSFTDDQIRWLEMMRDHIATSLEMQIDDFAYTPFAEQGGLGRAAQVFGPELRQIVQELNEVLAA